MISALHDELILNVDDTEAARYAKTRILTRAGFRVIEAANGSDALDMARSEKPALILLDVKLPDINGFEVCRLLKQDTATSMVLVLQTSASYIASADKIRALEGGADNYLFEPIEPEELVANVRALLRLSRVERELREMDRRKTEFLAVLAHELRNPLGPIQSAVELLAVGTPNPSQSQDEARRIILRQTEHMVRLVDDLLDISRISQGKINLHYEPVELKTITRFAIEVAKPNIASLEHRLTVALPEEEIWVRGDKVRLSQIMGNLLKNAAKFTSPQGQLGVSIHRSGDWAVIKVEDNGIGLAPEETQSIFTMFSQARHLPTRVQDGLGIGLALVKTLVELHGGTVAAASAGHGQGSTFEVRLPLAIAEQHDAPKPVDQPSQDRRYRILVVDDNVDAASTLGVLLQVQGHDVLQRHDGTSAIESATAFSPEVAILDIGLPDMTGFDVAARLREQPATADMIIIALSGYGQEKDREQAKAAGFDDHLTKPVASSTLLQTIRRSAERRKRQ